MKLTIIALAVGLALSGCAQIAAVKDKSTDEVAKLVAAYCISTSELTRQSLRAEVNAKLAGVAEIKIDCKISQ